ncbi:SH3 and PX domain-containing protein 2B isoform X2 [Stegostoma tigrinum]|uniref:SH3 and PX domain-containing protein 2B isoform X2 n=1 Tax=Stegostoma tigrinum TaxID=3053191 RepID=UPI00202B2D41|nr:SH3 and PX domain-containing protein 2B isoform X2 [Stegostoma tigrinum]
MPRSSIVDVKVQDVQKRRIPNKHYVYIIQVTWSSGSTEVIYRRYSRFFNLQMQLLDTFPVEGGQKDPKQRYIPFLPGKILFRRSHIRDVAVKRLKPIDEYCRALIRLPAHISQCDEVLQFFETRPEDLNPPIEEPIGKKKSGGDGASADQFLLDQYVAVTNYDKQESTEISLHQGQVVEVIEKNESGWWFVSTADEQGWVPATCLEAQDGAQDDLSVVSAKPGEVTKTFWSLPRHMGHRRTLGDLYISVWGQEENFVVVYPYSARDNDEIDLERGAEVEVIQKNLEGWWKIRYKNQEGWAPASYLKKATSDLSGQKITSGQSVHSSAMDLDGLGKQPASAKETREKALLFDQKDEKNEIRGATGADVKGKLPNARQRPPPRRDLTVPRGLNLPKPPTPPEVEEEFYTIAAFQTTIPDGISFQAGQKVEVIEKNLSGWWYIQIDDEEGWAPASFIDKYKKSSNASRANFLPPLAQELAKLQLDGTTGSSSNGDSAFVARPLPKEPQSNNVDNEATVQHKLKEQRGRDASKSPSSDNKYNSHSNVESQSKSCSPSNIINNDTSRFNKEKPVLPLKKEQINSKFEVEALDKHSKVLPPKPSVPGGILPLLPPKMSSKGDKKLTAEASKISHSKGLESGPKMLAGEVARSNLKPVGRQAKSKPDTEEKSVDSSPNLPLKPRPLLRPKPFPVVKGESQSESEVDISNLRSKLRRAKLPDKMVEQDSSQNITGNQNYSNNQTSLDTRSSSPGNVENVPQLKQDFGISCKVSDVKVMQREQNGLESEQNDRDDPSMTEEKAAKSLKPIEKKGDDPQPKGPTVANKEGPPRPIVPPRRPPLPKKTSIESADVKGYQKDTPENKPTWGQNKPSIPPPRFKSGSSHEQSKDEIKAKGASKEFLPTKGSVPSKVQEYGKEPILPAKATDRQAEMLEMGKEKNNATSINMSKDEESSKECLYVALADFAGDEETAGFKEGTVFEVFEKNANGWWYCKILNSEPTWEGWAPSNYLIKK